VPSARRRPGITVHRAVLAREDIARTRGLRVTSPARTLLDLAPRLTQKQIERAADDMRNAGFLRAHQVAGVVERYRRHPGVPRLLRIVESPHGPTRSDFEQDFIAFVKRFGLPTPLINTKVGGREVDALFADERVIVELDGWGFHGSRTSFRNDRKRDAELLALGYVTVRITWERLAGEPDAVAAEVRSILAQRAFLRSAG